MSRHPLHASLLATGLLALGLAACGPARESDETGARRRLEVWAHAGQEAERLVLEDQAARFNAAQDSLRVELIFLPEGSYNAQVQAAALAGELPDLLEFDGPFLATYVWQGRLRALDGLVSAALLADLLPSLRDQGKQGGRLYSLGCFDSGLALYGRRSQLEAAGLRLPRGAAAAWSLAEFEAALEALASGDADGAVLDLKLNYAGEWFTYGFSPLLQSAGGDLLDREILRATGSLDGPASVRAMSALQGWIARGRVDPNLDDAAFTQGRVALAWGGHWNWPAYSEAWGDDLLLLPLPDLGQGSRTGQGSWAWALTASCPHPAEAAAFLDFLLSTDEVLAMAAANGAVPGTLSALARSPLFGKDGPLRLFADQLTGGFSRARPPTPAYPMITSAFQEAFERIRSGGDVQKALGEAARSIDAEIAANRGYPPSPREE